MTSLLDSKFVFLAASLLAAMVMVVPTPGFSEDSPVASIKPQPQQNGKYLFSVTLHTRDEISSMLTRAEMLSKTLLSNKKDHAGIALVLHGPEIELFTKKNYDKNQQLIDKASRVDSCSVIEIKVCRTAMDDLDIKKKDLPAFVEIVPYGPDEEERLVEKGYTYL